jgi:hypothetical protein
MNGSTLRCDGPWRRLLAALGLLVAGALAAAGPAGAQDDDMAIARSLAEMLRAGRAVVSSNQARINDAGLGDKGLDGKEVLAQAVKIFQKSTGIDPMTLDPASRHGRLLRAQMAAIAEVMDANQATINAKGVSFKAFIPAVFARLVNEAFEKRAQGEALIKVTAPQELVRNRKARPDAWENDVIKSKLLAADWPKGQVYAATADWPEGQVYAATADANGRQAFRMMVPEYYAASCLSCHGSPKGELDITGYPKEGGKENDLGAVISLVLFK